MKHLLTFFTAGILCFCASAGQNLYYNSSFELGEHGWANGICDVLEEYIGKVPPKTIADSTTAVHGKTSLKVTVAPGFGITWPMTSPDVSLKLGQKYTVSFYAKAKKPDYVNMMMYTNHKSRWLLGSKRVKFNFTTEWKRYSYSFVFNPDKIGRTPDFKWFLLVDFPKNPNEFNFDALQIEEGELTEYKPAASVEYMIKVPDVYWQDKSEIPATVRAVSYNRDQNIKGNLVLSEVEKAKELSKTPFGMNLKKGQAAETKVTVKKLPYGALRLQVAGTPLVSSELFVKIHENKAKYQPGKFAVGIGTIALGLPEGEVNNEKDRVITNFYQIDEGDVVRRSGSVFTKPFDGRGTSTFAGFAPNKRGEYNWTVLDRFIAKCKKYDLQVSINIAAQALYVATKDNVKNTFKKTGNVPEWLAKLDRFGKTDTGTCLGDWSMVYCVFPPADVIAEAAEAMISRYKDSIFLFRLYPEANGYMTPEMLAEYAKAVYIRGKKAAPNVIFNTCTPTEDLGVKMSGYFYRFLKAGGGKYCDLYAFHPYRSTQDDSPLSAMDGISTFKDNMQAFKMVKPLGNLECFYLVPAPASDYRLNNYYASGNVARRLLIDMGEGVLLSAPLELGFVHGSVAAVEANTRFFRRAPDARFATHNAMGYFLNGAVNPIRLKLPGETLCYTFENHGKKYSAIWNIAGKTTMKLSLPAGISCEAFDHFGNSLGKFKKSVTLNLDREPKIICWSKDADPAKIHSIGSYAGDTKAVFFGLKRVPGGLAVVMKNTSSKPLSGMLRLESRYTSRAKAKFENIKSFENSHVVIPCSIKADAPAEFEATLVIMLDGKVKTVKFPVQNVPVVQVTASGKKYQLGEHAFSLKKEGRDLVVYVELKSKKMRIPQNPKFPWEGDSVECFIDMAPASYSNPMSAYHDDCVQIVVSATKSGKVEPLCMPKKFNKFGAKADVKLVPGGAKVTIRIPYRKYMGFTITANGGESSHAWRGTKNFCNRSAFAVLEIK